jgi:glyceraldehyde-3-phosphate dehydrogenase (ferredoxin)
MDAFTDFFHRVRAEGMMPEIIESLYGPKEQLLKKVSVTASHIDSRNSSVFWESERTVDLIHTFLKRRQTVG